MGYPPYIHATIIPSPARPILPILDVKENHRMFEYELDNLASTAAPPTRDDIERIRQKQFDALKAMQEKLLEVIASGKSAA